MVLHVHVFCVHVPICTSIGLDTSFEDLSEESALQDSTLGTIPKGKAKLL